MISVLVLTKNEEQDLPGCLDSVKWSDDVHVFDSFSTDRTVEIALAAGARITQRHFDDWSSHQNWGLANIPFRYPWVLYVDADERVSPELSRSLRNTVKNPENNVAFRVRRRDFWGKQWLKHAVASSFYIRLFLPQHLRYERLVNPISLPDGPVGELDGVLDHFPFSKGIGHWLNRHNSYSTFEAQQIIRNRAQQKPFSLMSAFFAKDPNERRFHQKELFYRMPARPLMKFLVLYLGKRGFLDGRGGFDYAALQSFYEYMIVLKTSELNGRQISAEPARAAEIVFSMIHSKGTDANPSIND
jgi:glycosyltransferase involved in cell wall biosynthesis